MIIMLIEILIPLLRTLEMSFRKYIRQLNQLEIISSKTVRIEEAERGRHLEITLLDIPAVKLEEFLIDIFNRKFD